MSVSRLIAQTLGGASTLWITSQRRALAALIGAALVFGSLAAFEISEPWRMFAKANLRPDSSPDAKLVVSLAKAAASTQDIVLMVGGSTTMELTGSDSYLSHALSKRCGRKIRFVNAGSSSQTIAEAWQIAFAMPADRLKLVIPGMNYLRFEEGFSQVRNRIGSSSLPLPRSQELSSTLARLGHPVRVALPEFKQAAWFLAHRGEMAADRPMPDAIGPGTYAFGPRNFYRAPALPREEKRLIVTRMIIERTPQYLQYRSESVALWRAFVARLKEQGTRTEFLILPESATMAPIDNRLGALLLADVRAAASPDASFADWRHVPGLSEMDFYDQQHLLASGRRKLMEPFVAFVAQRLGNCAP